METSALGSTCCGFTSEEGGKRDALTTAFVIRSLGKGVLKNVQTNLQVLYG